MVGLGIKRIEQAGRRALEGCVVPHAASDPKLQGVAIRLMESHESPALSRLFCLVYGCNYIHEYVYDGDKLKAMIEAKRLISMVASLPDGRLIGHVGLLKRNDAPAVYELCLGVVDPALKRCGIFGQIFTHIMELSNEASLQYCVSDLVTNHVFTQQCVAKYHPVDISLFVGCQSKVTQANLGRLGLGEDPKATDRYTLLYSIFPGVAQPFGSEIELPLNLGGMLGFLLKPLNLNWYPASRLQRPAPLGRYHKKLEPAQNSVVFQCHEPGRQAVENIRKEWRQLLRSGYQYAAVEVPVGSAGIGHLYDALAEDGFFVGGFVPWHCSERLGLRFQALGPARVDFDEIRLYTDTARQLLSIIRENYVRNAGL